MTSGPGSSGSCTGTGDGPGGFRSGSGSGGGSFGSGSAFGSRVFTVSQLRPNFVILVGFPHPVKLGYVVGEGSPVTFRELIGVQNVLDAAD